MPNRDAAYSSAPTFPDGFHCSHGYPPGECCPACGEIPDPMAGVLVDEAPWVADDAYLEDLHDE